MIQHLLQTNGSGLSQIVFLLLGGGTLGVVVTAIVQWVRFKKKDESETTRTDAETLKIKAEAGEIKAKAEVTVADAALKLAQRLSDECDMARKQLERTQEELDRTAQQLRTVTTQLHFVQAELDDERHRNTQIMTELRSLKDELDKLKADYANKK